jgi:uncharacterized protein with beta-barrel porin domain
VTCGLTRVLRALAAAMIVVAVVALAAPAVAQVATGGAGGPGSPSDAGGNGGNAGANGTNGTGTGPGLGGSAGTSGSPNGVAGGLSGVSGAGGGGGGFSFPFSGNITMSSTGGSGGAGGGSFFSGGGGGGGGDGARISAGSAVVVSATVTGGTGGNGGEGDEGGSHGNAGGGGAGGGGAGVVMQTASGLTVNAAVIGGAGGVGGPTGGTESSGGGGGGGGAGVILQQGGSLSINAAVSGGAGGNGGVNAGGGSSGGGSGGGGVVANTAATVTVSAGATVTGGLGFETGSGGAGLALSAGGTVVNAGRIIGGNGGGEETTGLAGSAGGTGSGGAPGFIANVPLNGVGGVGIVGAGLSIVNSGSIAGGTGLGGQADAIEFTAGSNSLTLAPGYSIIGNVVGTGADTFQLGGSSGSATFNLGLIGATQQYQGFSTFNVVGATWTVTGTYGQTDPWAVEAGTLNVTGDLSSATNLTVTAGTLMGTGTVGNTQINDGGIFAPGNGTPGSSMTVSGKLTFASGATYQVQVNPSTSSFANVTGTAALAGTVNAVFSPGSYVSKQYIILQSAGLDGTTFSGLTNTNLPLGITDNLSYSANDDDVFLNLTASLGASTPLNQNQQTVANAINNFFNSGGALPPGFVNVFNLSGANLANGLTQLDGENATGAEHGAFQLMNGFLDLMVNGGFSNSGGANTGFFNPGGANTNPFNGGLHFAPDQQADFPPEIALAYAGVLKAPPQQTFVQRWTAWGASFGGSATANGDAVVGSNNVTTSTFGYAAGMNYHYSPDTVLGFALAGGGTNWNLAQGLGTGRSDAFLAGLYGVTHQGPVYLAGALAFANNWFSTNRTALGDQLTASFQGQSYAGRLEGGYRFVVPAPFLASPASGGGGLGWGAIGITPYAAIQTQDFHTPAYSETDLTSGGFGLSYAAMNGTDARSELGARFDDPTLLGAMPLILRARLAWAHDWASNPALNASFESLPGTGFTVNGAPIPHDSALTSAGAELFFTPNWSFLAKFDGEFASGSQIYAGTGTLRCTW